VYYFIKSLFFSRPNALTRGDFALIDASEAPLPSGLNSRNLASA
jgi:hypothetical protein